MNPILAQFLGALGTLALYIFGIFLAAYYNATFTPDTGNFDFKKFWADNADAFIRSLVWGVMIVVLVTFVKEASEVMQLLGFVITVPVSGGGAVILGATIYQAIRKKVKFDKVKLDN